MRIKEKLGQNSLEYLMVVGAIAVVLAGLLILGFSTLLPEVLGYLCPSVDTASDPASSIGSCLGG
ncbi:MAG: hypothetical protein FJ320_11280 [SAR202 cluster bacterium]|nr:hypothetical protein [SAR202 cluster bacterium]